MCSPSIDTLESINSACAANLLSEQGVCCHGNQYINNDFVMLSVNSCMASY